LCRILDWDSEFFRRRIASFTAIPEDRAAFDRAIVWCRSERVDCVYLRSHVEDLATRRMAEDNDFRLVDLRVTYVLEFASGGAPTARGPEDSVRLARGEDVPDLRALAAASHTNTRFWSDERFPREDCAELYAIWIEKSVQGGADVVFVGEHEGRVAGYFTCLLKPERKGEVGLVAVAPAARGRGLARVLTDRALGWFRERGCTSVTVATQGSNVPGRRLYENMGFRSLSLELWHHGWLDS
jgi:dTDP-4-amino-4,6-dideoxy-D-galactose acyltransferase